MKILVNKTDGIYSIIVLATILLMILGQVTNSIVLMLSLVFLIILILLGNDTKNFYILVTFLPNFFCFGELTNFSGHIIVLFIALKYFLSKGINKKAIALALLMMISEAIHIFLYVNILNVLSFVFWVVSFIYCFSILQDDSIDLKYRDVSYSLINGLLLSIGSYSLVNMDYIKNIVSNLVNGNRFEGYAGDPNYFALYVCIAFAMLSSAIEYCKFDNFLKCILLVLCIITGSKMGLLIITFIILFDLAFYIKNSTTKKYKIIVLCSIVIITSLLLKNQIMTVFNFMISRFGILNQDNTLDHLTTGRSTIQLNYLKILIENPSYLLLGFGIDYCNCIKFSEVNTVYDLTNHYAHNTYIDVLLSWGLIGFVEVLSIIIYEIKCYKLKFVDEVNVYSFLGIFVLGIGFFALSFFNASMFWYVISLGIIALNNKNKYGVSRW